jgi:hypothetical protein
MTQENSSFPSSIKDVVWSYGIFMVAWAVLEGIVQAGIRKELGISAEKSVIVTGKLQFNPRVQLLVALLKLHGDKHKEAINLLNKFEAFAKRNSIVHGMVGSRENGKITFTKYDGAGSTSHSFSAKELLDHSRALTERTVTLRDLLGLTDADSQEISNATAAFVK